MPGTDWSEAVEIAVRRLVARTGSAEFTRQQISVVTTGTK